MPELNVAVFAFLLNFVWEFLQTPFFYAVSDLKHSDAVKVCLLATIGDVAIMLVGFWGVAVVAQTRLWILGPAWRQLAGFMGIGVAVTLVIERLALSSGRWAYSEAMPLVPILGIGLTPFLQWIIVPLMTAWFVRRQLT